MKKAKKRRRELFKPHLLQFYCYWHNQVRCTRKKGCEGCKWQPPDDKKPNGKNEPLPIKWEESYDGIYPECPACGEMPYGLDRCFFCGQKFIKDERAKEWEKPPKIETMDCFKCGGKNTVEYVRARCNGHRHGYCKACGMRFIE